MLSLAIICSPDGALDCYFVHLPGNDLSEFLDYLPTLIISILFVDNQGKGVD